METNKLLAVLLNDKDPNTPHLNVTRLWTIFIKIVLRTKLINNKRDCAYKRVVLEGTTLPGDQISYLFPKITSL